VSLALIDMDAMALGFGEPQVASALGQPLRMRIPLHVDGDLDVSSQCMRLIGAATGDTLPTLSQARLTIEEHGAERSLRIDSLLPVSEPILRVTVEAGCLQRVRREFVILLDPPESATPNIVAGPVVPILPPGAPAPGLGTGAPAPGTPPGTPGTPDVGLGIARVDGRVGQPLTMQIPLSGPGAGTVDPGCVHLADALSGDGAPVLNQAKLSVDRVDGQTTINLVTPDAVMEPALRVILEVGCDVPLRREYGVLLDNSALPAPPPPLNPIAAAAPAPVPEPAASAAPATAFQPTPPVVAEAPPPVVPAPAPKPRHKPHKSSLASVKPAPAVPAATSRNPASAPAVPPLAAAQPEPAPAVSAAKPAPAPKAAKTPAPESDHLTLSAADDQATAAALKIAEMDKRVEDLTKEVSQLRAELAAERQNQSEAAARQQRGGLGWIVAALSLLGLAVGSVLVWQRGRSSGSWHGGAWNDADGDANTRASTTALKVDTVSAALPPSPRPVFGSVPSVPPKPSVPPPTISRPMPYVPPPPRATRPGAPLQEVEVETTPASMDITELQHNEPSLEKLRTLFNDVNESPTNSPEDDVISGLGRLTVPLDMPLSPTESPAVPPTVLQPPERGATFTFEDAQTQTPTLVALDLDLTTRVSPNGGNTVQPIDLDLARDDKPAAAKDTPKAPGSNSKH